MENYVYFNGTYKRFGEASIPLTDRGIYFGDGCYDVMLVRNGIPYQLEEHFERLVTNCKALKIRFDLVPREFLSIVHRLCDLSCISTAVIYVQVTRNGEKRNHEFKSDRCNSNLLITVSEYSIPTLKRLNAITVSDKRHTICNVKSLNLLYSVLALNEANEKGADAAIFIRDGFVTEESRSNVFIVKDGAVITHPLGENILPGVVRGKVIDVAREAGIGIQERKFTVNELFSADEVFISSTTRFISTIAEIDGNRIKSSDSIFTSMIFDALVGDFREKTH